jgi:ERO1-like protein alpha
VDRRTSLEPTEFPIKSSSDCNVPEFWVDMCSDISTVSKKEHLDLRRNPERWTGYNGSKIWAAIYEENCFSKGGKFSDMCYEERVLYRMLSGMHSSINIHIATHFYPPSAAAGRTTWQPNAARFDELFADHPERLKNLHFAFVVTLRAVRKAANFLSG